jgi:SAM-dependent methyltransferase
LDRLGAASGRSLKAVTDWSPNYSLPAGSGAGWVEDYERGRPGYPTAAIEAAGIPARATVLDLGAGTGKLTRLLLGTFARVIAVEPAEAMRGELTRRAPAAEAVAGTAERIPLADDAVDAVFAAEVFHHFHGARAVAEIARVLRPAGALVLLWNLPAGKMEPPIDAVERIVDERGLTRERLGYDPLDLNSPRHESGEWRRPFQGSAFAPLEEARLEHVQVLDREALVALIASMGWVGDLPDDERLPLLDRIRSLLESDQYRRRWRTHVCWTRLT